MNASSPPTKDIRPTPAGLLIAGVMLAVLAICPTLAIIVLYILIALPFSYTALAAACGAGLVLAFLFLWRLRKEIPIRFGN